MSTEELLARKKAIAEAISAELKPFIDQKMTRNTLVQIANATAEVLKKADLVEHLEVIVEPGNDPRDLTVNFIPKTPKGSNFLKGIDDGI